MIRPRSCTALHLRLSFQREAVKAIYTESFPTMYEVRSLPIRHLILEKSQYAKNEQSLTHTIHDDFDEVRYEGFYALKEANKELVIREQNGTSCCPFGQLAIAWSSSCEGQIICFFFADSAVCHNHIAVALRSGLSSFALYLF